MHVFVLADGYRWLVDGYVGNDSKKSELDSNNIHTATLNTL